MDVALEIEEKVNVENYTANSTDNKFYDDLYPHQVVGLFFNLYCLAPNILLIYIICKNKLNSTVYWIMANWSVLNSVLLLNFLLLNIIPMKYISRISLEIAFYFDMALVTFTGITATLFMFDFYLNSEKAVKYSIKTTWFLIVCCDLFTVGATLNDQMDIFVVPFVMESCLFAVSFVFLMKIIHSWARPNRYHENYRLRIRLSSTYLVCLFLMWAAKFMVYVHYVYNFVAEGASIVISLDGYGNLTLLIYFDARIKRFFMQMFCVSDKYSDIRFDGGNSTDIVADQNVDPTKA